MKKWINSNWGRTIIIAVVVFIATTLRDYKSGEPFFFTISKIWEYILIFLNMNFPMWLFLVVVVLLAFWRKLVWNSAASEEIPEWVHYTSGILINWKWYWKYEDSGSGNGDIVNLIPECPKCETLMIHGFEDGYEYYRCPKCQSNIGGELEKQTDVKALIADNIKRGAWKQKTQ